MPGEETGAWTFAYYGEQVLWADPCDSNRKTQFWTGWSLSDGNPSFGRWGGFASIESWGPLPGRSRDRMGIAYFYNQLSSDVKSLVNTLPDEDVQNIHGGEVYYNYAITPFSKLTFDFQAVDNSNVADDVAVVLGARLHLQL